MIRSRSALSPVVSRSNSTKLASTASRSIATRGLILSEAVLGAPIPPSELRRQVAPTPNGSIQAIDRSVAEAGINEGTNAVGPDYTGIDVPVTALIGDDADPAAAFPLSALATPEVRESLRDCAGRLAEVKRVAGADPLRAAVPSARIEIVSGGPHYFFLQQPELVTEEILATAARAGW